MPTKQKSGLYRTKIKIGVDADGKDVVKWVSGRTKKELDDAKRNIVEQYISGKKLASDKLLGEFAVEWYKTAKAPGLSASSLESYRTALNKNILPELGDRNLRAISALELQNFVNSFAGASTTKITVVCAALKGIFESACAAGILQDNPMLHVRKSKATPPPEKPALTSEQREKIEAVCASSPDALFLALMYYAGLRPGEARGLQWGDVDWGRKTIHVQRDIDYKARCAVGDVKTRKSNRVIPIPEALYSILGGVRGMPEVFIVRGEKGGALAKTSSERLWVRLMHKCGMVEPAHCTSYGSSDIRSQWKPIITPHVIRHNFATMCWEAGLDPYTTMKLMGHASIKTTMDIYTHLNDRQLDALSDKVEAVFGSKKADAKCEKTKKRSV